MRRSMVCLFVVLLVSSALAACGDDSADELVIGGADPDADNTEESDESDSTDESESTDDSDFTELSDQSDESDELTDGLSDFFTDEFSDFSDSFSDFGSCGTNDEGGCAEYDPDEGPDLVEGLAPPGPIDDFDELWVECSDGDDAACDDLYLFTPSGSLYEAYGITCAGREPDGFGGSCDFVTTGFGCGTDTTGGCGDFDGDYTVFDPSSSAPGPAADFDDDWTDCGDGDLAACDSLWSATPGGSIYEAYAASCGGRYDNGDLATRCEDEG